MPNQILNIAFLTSEYPEISTRTGGIGVSIMNLANCYAQIGHKVSVFIYGMDSDLIFSRDRINFITIKNPKFKGFSWLLLRLKLKKVIINFHRNNKIDFIEVPDWCGISAFLKLPFPIVLKCNGSDAFFCYLDSRKQKYFNYLLEKTAFNNADYVFCVSSFCANITKKIFKSNRKTFLVRNGFHPSVHSFTPRTVQLINSVYTVLYFGTIVRKKGVLELAGIFESVLQKYKNVQFLLVGYDSTDILTRSTSTFQLFDDMCSSEVKKSTKYLGALSQSEVFDLIAQADVCVFPSFAEAFPLSWLEAMYFKKGIVASNIGWASEVIDHGKNGLLISPTDHHSFADAIISLFDDKLRFQMGENAHIKVLSEFSVHSIAQRTIELYSNMI
jgi:glycosyltransferase involved in cell wall biosynthesis